MRITHGEARQLGTVIAKARLKKGLSLGDVAIEIGMSKNWMWDLEKGNFLNPSPGRLLEIAEVLDIDAGHLDRVARGGLSQGLPHIKTYFRAKYRMDPSEIDQVVRYVNDIYGGPA
jgi:transcriptional regulator with XRE-family HTH domain